MALVKCSECGKEISDKAFTCPNCGNPIQAIRNAQISEQNKKYSKEFNLQMRLYNILALVSAAAFGMYLIRDTFRMWAFVLDILCYAIIALMCKYWLPLIAALFVRKYRQQEFYQIPKFSILISACFGYVVGYGIGGWL